MSGEAVAGQMGSQKERQRVARPIVRVEDGRKVLRVGGVIQSVAVDETYSPDVWDALLPETRPANALILGLGGGVVAMLLTQRWGALPIVGVEHDPAIVWLAQHEFGLSALTHLEIVVEDAFAYVRRCAQRFDVICVDLYSAGKLAHGALGAAFLRDVARLLSPTGVVTYNLWRSAYLDDQLRRISQALTIRSLRTIDENVIVVCSHSLADTIQDGR